MSRFRFRVCLLLTIFILPAAALPVLAQEEEQPKVYARIASWTIERAHWGNFVKLMEDRFIPVLENQLNQGVIFEWGLTTRALHSADGPTHSLWFTAHTIGALLRTTEAIDAVEQKLAMAQDAGLGEFQGAVKGHSDSLVQSAVYASRPVDLKSGYVSVFNLEAAPGHADDFGKWWRKYIQPVYQGLLDDGTIAAYGMDIEEYSTDTPRARSFWVVVPNAEGIDAIDTAFEKQFSGRSEEEQRGIFEHAVTELTEWDSARGYLSQVIRYVVK